VSDESEIEKIRGEEVERGRRPKHSSQREKLRRLKSLMLHALHKGNRVLFQQVLIDLGQKLNSSEYEASMKMYEDYQRERR